MYLSECEEEAVTVAICKKKMTEDGGVNGERWTGLSRRQGAKLKG